MIIDGVGHRVLRVPLPVPVIVDYQIACEPHQPICEVALLRVVLVERAVNANKNILCEIFRRVDARGKAVREVEYPSRERGDNILPRRPIACSGSTDEFRTIYLGHSLKSFQFATSLLFLLLVGACISASSSQVTNR